MRRHILLLVVLAGCIIEDKPRIKCSLSFVTYSYDNIGTENDFTVEYFVTYEAEKPTRLDYFEADNIGFYSGFYTLEYDGDYISIIVWERSSYKSKYEFTRNGKLVTERRFYNYISENYTLSSREVFTYNGKDQLTKRDFYNASNTKIGWNEYSYTDSSPNPSSVTFYPDEVTYEYTYSSKKPSLKQLNSLRGQVIIFTKEFKKIEISDVNGYVTTVYYAGTYNDDNFTEKLVITDEESDAVNTYEFEYDCDK